MGPAFAAFKEECMQISELGDIAGPVAVYGGPCSNAHAVRRLFDLCDAWGVAKGARISTGDVVGYAAQPAESVALVRARGGPVVAGNVERQLAAAADTCGCGFGEGTTCAVLAEDWYAFARRQIGAEARRWMEALPDVVTFAQAGRRFAALHGGVTDIARFLWPVSPGKDFATEIEALERAVGPVDVILAGHAGIPFRKTVGRHLWVNAGNVGMPANDGRPETAFAMVEGGEVRILRLGYDWAAAQATMRARGVAPAYAEALGTGWWPSEEVLPPAMQRQPRDAGRASGGTMSSRAPEVGG